jgi:hypothetical protein
MRVNHSCHARTLYRKIMRFLSALILSSTAALSTLAPSARAQDSASHVVSGGGVLLGAGGTGIGIGNVPRVNGIRLNYRDSGPIVVTGLNATIWRPYDRDAMGMVTGVALGVPMTGARRITGVGLGFGLEADHAMHGIMVAPIGLGAGNEIGGLAIAGLGAGTGGRITGITLAGIGAGAGQGITGAVIAGVGAGSGGDLTGLVFGGVGAGSGGNVRGVAVGGVGVGAAGDLNGITIGGVGAGAGGQLTGLAIGGIGAGVGGNADGVLLGGIGVGAGGRVRGLMVGGIGAGAGGGIEGVAIAGIGAGAPYVRGVLIAPVAGGANVRWVALAPAYFRILSHGTMHGVSLSTVNDIRGAQHGLAIGVVNIARELHGVQLGLLNWAGNKRGAGRLLPIVNVSR